MFNYIPENREYEWRMLVGNINGSPLEGNRTHQSKYDVLRELIRVCKPDITCISEHKKRMSMISRNNKPAVTMKNWMINTISRYTWMRNDSDSKDELGGTGILTSGKASTHTIGSGEDIKQMGRWNWVTMQGKRGIKTTIISIYRPEDDFEISNRQHAHLCKNYRSQSHLKVTQVWEDDIITLIEKFVDEGHNIIVAGDWNDNLNDNESKVNKMMHSMGLREVLIQRYGKGPNTHMRGSTTIDGIFASEGINIIQGGYTTIEDSPSDHRWLWIDIEEQGFIGTKRDDYAPPLERRATSKIPSVKQTFEALCETQVKNHKLLEKAQKVRVYGDANNDLDDEHYALYNEIEDRLRRLVKYADRKCRKIKRGKTPFSPKLKTIIGKIKLFRAMLQRKLLVKKSCRPRSRYIKRLAKRVQYEGPLDLSKDELLEKLSRCRKNYQEFKPTAQEHRYRHLQDIAVELADTGNIGVEGHYRRLLRQERLKEKFKNISRVEKKKMRCGVNKVDIDTPQGVQTILDRNEIDKEIIKANQAKRLQAGNTPLRIEPLRSLIGEKMDFQKWEKLLLSQIDLTDMDMEEGTKAWFDYIQAFDDRSTSITWTVEEYVDSWKKMKEDKSSLPGIHAAHIKCLSATSDTAAIMSIVSLLPFITGKIPSAWKYGIDSMIPKKAKGEYRPSKLRLILLMDARFNHNNKLIGKKIMEFGEKNKLLADEQYGSRKNKSAIDHAVNKRLTLDVSRLQKANCIYIANDAKSCYDRILLVTMYLTLRHYGIDKQTAKATVFTLTEMKLRVKTVYGVSELSYGGDDWDDVPHGCGQGSGLGPAIWAAISSTLLIIMRAKGYGVSLHSPITKEHLQLSCFSFVDDTDQMQMTMANKPWEEMIETTQQSLTMWESLLRTTGGALDPSKSDWSSLTYTWKNGIAISTSPTDYDLHMRNPEGEVIVLQKLKAKEARETLGVWQAMDGNENTQVAQLIKKIKTWGGNISKSDMTRGEARTASTVTIGKTVRYPLAATTISREEARSIDHAFRWSALGKMGIVRTAAILPAAAPIKYGGLGLQNEVFANQMIDHLTVITLHGHSNTTTGQLIRITFESIAVEAGIGGDPGKYKPSRITWLTDRTWVKNTLEAMEHYHLELNTTILGLKEWTNRDDFFMEICSRIPDLSQIRRVNKVRMFLRVSTLSDLMTADGKGIDVELYHGRVSGSPSPSISAYTWPNINEVDTNDIEAWKKALQMVFKITDTDLRLHEGSDFVWDSDHYHQWKWSYDPEEDYIYRKSQERWVKYSRGDRRYMTRSSIVYSQNLVVDNIPRTCLPISVKSHRENITIISKGKTGELENETDDTEGWILRDIESTDIDEMEFIAKLSEGATIVTDGSYKDDRSSSAFTVLPSCNITGTNTVPGPAESQSSYRGELAGILAGVVYTNRLCNKYRVTQGSCVIACDNKGAVQSSMGWKRPTPKWSCYDILTLIRHHVSISPIQWKTKHVRGHQDAEKEYDALTDEEKANVLVDELAKKELAEAIEPDSTATIAGQCWSLINEVTQEEIVGNSEIALRSIIYEHKMKDYWKEKFNLEIIDYESWGIFKQVCKDHQYHQAIWLSKYNQRILGVAQNLVRRKHATEETCPCCHEIENTDHIFKCTSDSANASFQAEILEVEDFLSETTSDSIKNAILEVCTALREDRRARPLEIWGTDLGDVVIRQVDMGQRATIAGIWDPAWTLIQAEYHKSVKSKRKGKTWMVRVIHKIQTMVHNIWKRRNKELHETEACEAKVRENQELNAKIDDIFDRKAVISNRCMTHGAATYFKKRKNNLKRMRIKRKRDWIRDAEEVLDSLDNQTEQAQRFLKYFQFRDAG